MSKSATRKIIAIGGGEIGRPGFPVETTAIDQEIVRLTKKKRPRFLFIPTASYDSPRYMEVVEKHFGRRLGCRVDHLCVAKTPLSKKEIVDKIRSADIVYVGGGDTLFMMKTWRRLGIDHLLERAWKRGAVMSGLSAGAICWFRYGNSDSRRFSNPDADLIKVRGLYWYDALFCPHYDVEKDRASDLEKMMQRTPGVAIACDNCCAIEIIDDTYRIISSKASAQAYKVFWKQGGYHREIIPKQKAFLPIRNLLQK